MNKRITVSVWLTTVIIAITVTFSLTMIFAMRRFDSTVASVKEKENMYAKIAEIDQYVRANDYYNIDETTLQNTIASGYIFGTGDKYAKYYTPEAYTTFVDIQSGKHVGVGVEAVKDTASGYAKVLTVYAGSPAEELGIKAGFFITNIGEKDVKNMASTAEIEAALLGESGTVVEVSWLNMMMESQSGVVTRRNYLATTVQYELLADRHAYLRVRTFNERTVSEIDYAVSQLREAGAETLVVDLRNNAGGTLEYAMEAVDYICNAGVIASEEYSDGSVQEIRRSYTSGVQMPLVFLVNENTASGAELLALNARLLNGAKLVGANTAGRGTLQSEPHRLSDGSAIVLTVAKLLANDGSCFDGTGVTVDVERALNADEQEIFYTYTSKTDPQIIKAISVADSLIGNATVDTVLQEEIKKEEANSALEGNEAVPESDEAQAPAEEDAASSQESTEEADTEAEESVEE